MKTKKGKETEFMNKYKISTDGLNVILQEKYHNKKQDTISWTNIAYFSEPKHALDYVINKDFKDIFRKLIKNLPLKEQNVLQMRFGFEDGCASTLEQVGNSFNVTRERIRQIESKAKSKLRNSKNKKILEDFLDNM